MEENAGQSGRQGSSLLHKTEWHLSCQSREGITALPQEEGSVTDHSEMEWLSFRSSAEPVITAYHHLWEQGFLPEFWECPGMPLTSLFFQSQGGVYMLTRQQTQCMFGHFTARPGSSLPGQADSSNVILHLWKGLKHSRIRTLNKVGMQWAAAQSPLGPQSLLRLWVWSGHRENQYLKAHSATALVCRTQSLLWWPWLCVLSAAS